MEHFGGVINLKIKIYYIIYSIYNISYNKHIILKMAAVDQGAAAGPPVVDLTDFRLLCTTACQQNPVEIKNTEVVASIILDNINLMAGNQEERNAADVILNAHMENFQDVMDEQEELDERIAFGMSVTPKDTNDGGSDYEPVLSGRSPTAAAAAAAAATEYTNLISFVNNLKSSNIAGQLISNMVILNRELVRICRGHAYVYNNIS